MKGRFNQVVMVYAEFISITTQQIKLQRLLPFPRKELEKSLEKADKYTDLLIAPAPNSIIEELVNLSLEYIMYKIFYYSKLAECSARLIHLEKSDQELIRINRQLRLEYFKSSHALADKKIREILSSRLLQKGR